MEANSGMHWQARIDLTTSSAVSLPITMLAYGWLSSALEFDQSAAHTQARENRYDSLSLQI
jgi:hypothetical protein